MEINGIKAIEVNGVLYWTVRQFSKLTDYSEPRIRSLIYYGNCLRKLKSFSFGSNKPLIVARELFDFPFVLSGRPLKEFENCVKVKKFYIEESGRLKSREEVVEKCQ
jgi:hypothetical protein